MRCCWDDAPKPWSHHDHDEDGDCIDCHPVCASCDAGLCEKC